MQEKYTYNSSTMKSEMGHALWRGSGSGTQLCVLILEELKLIMRNDMKNDMVKQDGYSFDHTYQERISFLMSRDR